MIQERREGQQVHKMRQISAPHPCHNPSCNPRMHCRQNLLHNGTHFLGRMIDNMGEKNVVETYDPRKKGWSASAQDGAGLCTTPMPQPLTQPSHALPTKPIAQPYLLAARKEARHGREACCGRHNPEEKGRLAMGGHSYARICHHTVTQPSHALSQNAICPTKLTACQEGTITREGNT